MVTQWPSKMFQLPFLCCPLPAEGDRLSNSWSPPLTKTLLLRMPFSMILLQMTVVVAAFFTAFPSDPAVRLSSSMVSSSAQSVPYMNDTQGESMDLGQRTCVTYDYPNELHSLFPNNATGVLNVTMAIVPIPLSLAESVIPSQYAILEDAFRALMPDFPEGMYPLFVQAGHDHDIRFQEFQIADFSRAGYEFPFIDLLHDGYSSFRWAPEQLIESTNPDAILGSRAYGTTVHPSVFDPSCNAYQHVPFPPDCPSSTPSTKTILQGTSVSEDGSPIPSAKSMTLEFQRHPSHSHPIPPRYAHDMKVYKNITNQPIFAATTNPLCDNMIRFFDTPASTGRNSPVAVRGEVRSNLGPFVEDTLFEGVWGIQVASQFVENNYLECSSLQGYQSAF